MTELLPSDAQKIAPISNGERYHAALTACEYSGYEAGAAAECLVTLGLVEPAVDVEGVGYLPITGKEQDENWYPVLIRPEQPRAARAVSASE